MRTEHTCRDCGRPYRVCPHCQCQYCSVYWRSCPRCMPRATHIDPDDHTPETRVVAERDMARLIVAGDEGGD